jgi:rod shape determining protein RodA
LPILIGTASRGSVRWIPIGGYTIQPSEIVKPFFVLMSAYYWSKRKFNYKNLFKFFIFFLPSFFLIFRQPDLGSSLVMLTIFIGMILFSGISIKQIFPIILVCAILLPLSWFGLKDYQKTRAIHFINPYADPLGEGYNVIQSKIAVGSGGFWGKGFGKGTQSHLSFLPERHTDFIFASTSEEFGFIGDVLIISLYFIIFQRILYISRLVREKKHFFLCVGIFFYFFFQTAVNIGMNIGIMPITGITLPFLSYGGSSILVSMICLGMVQNVYRDSNPERILIIK